MPILIVSVVLQVLLVLHIVKTGRSTTWIWLVVMLPIAGSIVYLIMEVIPDFAATKTGRKAKRTVVEVLNPDKDINAAASNYSVTDTVDNSQRLAEECLKKGMYEEAKQLYTKCLSGVFQDEPEFMFGLAQSEFGLNNFLEAKTILDDLIQKNPDYKNQEAHLLYAKSLDELDKVKEALEEYEILDGYYTGSEPTYRYAVLLKKQGETKKAKDLLDKIIHKADMSGGHYKSLNKKWIKLAKKEFNN